MSDYECYCEPQEGEACDVWTTKMRVARKSHKCCECREEIKAGDRYEYIFSVFEGDIYTYKTCEFCANEYKRLLKRNPDLMEIKGDLACVLVWDMRGGA